jgi:hypothetical protein
VEVWLAGERRQGLGRRVEDPGEASKQMRRLLEETKGLSKLLAGVDAGRLDDGTVQALTRMWPVVRIDLGEPERGAGPRPGDLAWVWLAAGALVLASRLRPRCRVQDRPDSAEHQLSAVIRIARFKDERNRSHQQNGTASPHALFPTLEPPLIRAVPRFVQ